MERTTRLGAIEMIAAMSISGTIGYVVLLSEQNPINVVFFRCAFAAPALALICWQSSLLRRRVETINIVGWSAIGGLAIVGNWLLLFAAFKTASISMATIAYQTQPFMLVILGALLFKERLEGWKLAWLGVAFLGFLLILQIEPAVLSEPGSYSKGLALSVLAALLYAVASLVTRRLKGTPPQLIALIQVSVGAALLAPFVDWTALPATGIGWCSLALIGLVHTALMYILLYGAIQKLPTAMVASLSFIYPVVAVLVDVVALGQSLSPIQIAGAILILFAAAGANLGWRSGALVMAQRRTLPCNEKS